MVEGTALTLPEPLPVYRDKRTVSEPAGTSRMCQFRKCSSLDRAQSKQRAPTKSDHPPRRAGIWRRSNV